MRAQNRQGGGLGREGRWVGVGVEQIVCQKAEASLLQGKKKGGGDSGVGGAKKGKLCEL